MNNDEHGVRDATALDWQRAAEQLAAMARDAGHVITIEQRPLQPLAMGNHEDVVTVHPARLQRAAPG